MGDLVKQSITDYLKKTRFDYSILIEGDWGTGKTYYIEALDISEITEKTEYKKIHISLAGLKSAEEVNTFILCKTIMNDKGGSTHSKDSKSIKSITQILNYHRIPAKWQNGINLSTKVVLAIMLSQKHIVFLDDLERYNGDFQELFSAIQMNFIEQGIHVIYIANEKKIDADHQYWTIKEKYIRHTTRFTSVQQQVLENVVSVYVSDSAESHINSLFKQNESWSNYVSRWMDTHEIRNLRSFLLALECYDYFSSIKELKNIAHAKHFFFSILSNIAFIKEGNKPDSDVTNFIQKHGFRETDDNDIFFPERDFFNLDEFVVDRLICTYIISGSVDKDAVADKIIQTYGLSNEDLYAIEKLKRYWIYEDREITEAIERLCESIDQAKLDFRLLIKLVSAIDIIDQYIDTAMDITKLKNKIISTAGNKSYPNFKAVSFASLKQTHEESVFLKQVIEAQNKALEDIKESGFLETARQIKQRLNTMDINELRTYSNENLVKYILQEYGTKVIRDLNLNGLYNFFELLFLPVNNPLETLPMILHEMEEEVRNGNQKSKKIRCMKLKYIPECNGILLLNSTPITTSPTEIY